jgi:hypothetical protein
VEVLIPILYLKSISTGDFAEALADLLGKEAPGLSASTIARLKEVWLDEHEHWRKRDKASLSLRSFAPPASSWRNPDLRISVKGVHAPALWVGVASQ